jgi:predicted amidohydrolase
MFRRLFALFFAIFGASCAQEWSLWAPRAEIQPQGEQREGVLILRGAGNPAAAGGWQRTHPGIRPGQWYRLTATYEPRAGIALPQRQVVARIDWRSAEDRRAGQPEYAWQERREGAARHLTLLAQAPPQAAAATVQLWLVEAADGVVHWRDISFAEAEPPAPRKARIATLRLRPKGEDPLARFIELARTAPAGADLILLPEGATVVGTGRSYADVAEPVPGPSTLRLGELARAKKAWVVAGVYEKEGGAVYNTAVLIDREGRYTGKYRKVYIPREELEGGITAGNDYPVFDTDFGRVGMMICWDVQYADPARALALRGAELILMPIWGGNQVLGRARAIENHVFLASSGYDYPSAVIDPDGETLTSQETNGTIAVAEIDLEKRYSDRWLGHMRGRFFRELRLDAPVLPEP